MKKLVLFALLIITTLAPSALLAAAPAYAQDDAKDAACDGVALTGGSCTPTAGQSSVQSTLTTVINLISLVVGVAAVIMIIIGGFKYVTSNGDSGSVSSAKDTILYAIIGLVIVAMAQVIVRFVIVETTSGAPKTTNTSGTIKSD